MPDSVSWRHESYSVRQYSVSTCPICDSPLGDPRSAASFRRLQSRRFLTKTRRYIDRGRHLEKQRKRLRGRGGVLNPSTSPLKTLFDSSQLSGSINFQDGETTSSLKTIHGSRPKIRLLCRPTSSPGLCPTHFLREKPWGRGCLQAIVPLQKSRRFLCLNRSLILSWFFVPMQ